MIFRQLFDKDTSTYTYILGDERTREAVIIDPVRDQVERDLGLLDELGLKLKYALDTHVHADHVTGSGILRRRTGAKTIVSKHGGAPCADMLVDDGDQIHVGDLTIEVRATPGHTNGCVTYVTGDKKMAFTGDALLIRGSGRTDFQQGNPHTLYKSVHDKIFSLPDETFIFPGHDYKGRTVTTVAEEKAYNERLGGGRSEAEFVEIMNNLNLPKPRHIDEAVPANLQCGITEASGEPIPEKAWAPIARSGTGVPEVSTEWVAEHGRQETQVIDVRRPDEFRGELGHIPEARLVPLDTLEHEAKSWDLHQPIVLVCRSGGRSGKAATLLESMGFHRVASMAGGMMAWNRKGLPVAEKAA